MTTTRRCRRMAERWRFAHDAQGGSTSFSKNLATGQETAVTRDAGG